MQNQQLRAARQVLDKMHTVATHAPTVHSESVISWLITLSHTLTLIEDVSEALAEVAPDPLTVHGYEWPCTPEQATEVWIQDHWVQVREIADNHPYFIPGVKSWDLRKKL